MNRIATALLLALLMSILSTVLAAAHPLGNFSVNRYSRLEVGHDEVQLRYVLDLAEIPTLQELRAAGIQPGTVDTAAHEKLLMAKEKELVPGMRLTIGGQPVGWTMKAMALDLLPGQADLDTLRVTLTLGAPIPAAGSSSSEGTRLEYRDTNYSGRAGWHEVVVQNGGGVDVTDSTVSSIDRTNELRAYPLEAERAPLDVSSALATVKWSVADRSPSHGGMLPEGALELSAGLGKSSSRFALDPRADQLAALLRDGAGATPLTLLLALAVAAGLGALHAFEPGHGKTVVGSYLVGSRGTAKHAALLGLTVTVTHTLGVYALGLVSLVAAQYIVPERLYPILGVVSGALVVAIGLSLVWSRLGVLLRRPVGEDKRSEYLSESHTENVHPHANHSHVDAHSQVHDHDHDHNDGHPHGHVHAADGHVHDHAHRLGPSHDHALEATSHLHDHDIHDHVHPHVRPDNHGGVVTLEARHEAGAAHSHGWGRTHSHALPGPDGSPVTIKSLLALGISGGLLPCPSALVVLLAAISFQSVGLGMLLVAAFSAGLATVLTAIGLVIVYGGRVLGRSAMGGRVSRSPLFRAVPPLGAVAITVAGLMIAVQAASTLL